MPELDEILKEARGLWSEALSIWDQGGWAMWALALIALTMFGMGVHVYLRLGERSFYKRIPEQKWRRWIHHPEQREGRLGDLLGFLTGGRSIKETATIFAQVRANETLPFERDLKVMKVCVSSAPLVGLLGTVIGMLSTFGALSSGSGGDQTMSQIAGGISEALITTETGLVIALPGLFFHSVLKRKFELYKAFLAHLESVCSQVQHKKTAERRRTTISRRRALEREAVQG